MAALGELQPAAEVTYASTYSAKLHREAKRFMTDAYHHMDEQSQVQVGREAPRLWGYPLTLMDVQNIFCEYGKYARWTAEPHAGASRLFKPKFDRRRYEFPRHIQIGPRLARRPKS